jgi:hypothetical protein
MRQLNLETNKLLSAYKDFIDEAGKAKIKSSQYYTGGKGNEQDEECQIRCLSSGEPNYLL